MGHGLQLYLIALTARSFQVRNYKYFIVTLNILTDCDDCYKNVLLAHTLSCPKWGLILARHNDVAKEWDAFSSWALNPSCISYKPKINIITI